jgi:glycosyltransferase involved in cell wall biosynthesis
MTRSQPYRLLAVDLEPTPYKVDLWNAFAADPAWTIEVLYTNARDYSADAGHRYAQMPPIDFSYHVLGGHSWWGSLKKMLAVVRAVAQRQTDGVFISGYVDPGPLAAIFSAALLGKAFFVHSDVFNRAKPKGRFAVLKRMLRDALRRYIFLRARAILVCGQAGYASALAVGCPPSKIIDFPYVVDRKRLMSDQPSSVPTEILEDRQRLDTIFYFSARMIERKGLGTLLSALAELVRLEGNRQPNWRVWIAGDGPQLTHYQALSKHLGIDQQVRWMGFVQMALHSYLLRQADGVIVPSLADAWGIVVDEGMQLGKAVITTPAVGSAIDRITDQRNGLIVPPGDAGALATAMHMLIVNPKQRLTLGEQAQQHASQFDPKRNVAHLRAVIDNTHEWT